MAGMGALGTWELVGWQVLEVGEELRAVMEPMESRLAFRSPQPLSTYYVKQVTSCSGFKTWPQISLTHIPVRGDGGGGWGMGKVIFLSF